MSAKREVPKVISNPAIEMDAMSARLALAGAAQAQRSGDASRPPNGPAAGVVVRRKKT